MTEEEEEDWPDLPDLDYVELFARQELLFRNVPTCPACHRTDGRGWPQIELTSSTEPAQWKCRYCKHRFEHEPGVFKHEE